MSDNKPSFLWIFILAVLGLLIAGAAPTPPSEALIIQSARQGAYLDWAGLGLAGLPALPVQAVESPLMEEPLPDTLQYIDNFTTTAFQYYIDGNWEIYTFDTYNLVNVRRLTANNVVDLRPRLNRGVTRVVYAHEYDEHLQITVANVDGSSAQMLTSDNADSSLAEWSADSSRLVYATDRDGNVEIYRMNADGSNLTRLTVHPATDVFPTWSPDGQRIAFIRQELYNNIGGGSVWVMDSDGGNPTQVTGWCPFAENLLWSPDGRYLALDCDANGDYWNDAIYIQPDGSGLTILWAGTYLSDVVIGGWGPQSDEILCNRIDYSLSNNQLYISNIILRRYSLTQSFYSISSPHKFDLYHYTQSRDISMPTSSILPLPEYSRAQAFLVRWQAIDPGPALIDEIQLETRRSAGAPWEYWLTANRTTNYFDYQRWYRGGQPGEMLYFRSQARDFAGNTEPWPTGDGDAYTQLYTYRLDGKLSDARDRPAPEINIDMTPSAVKAVRSSLHGDYQAYLTSYLTTTVQLPASPYGPAFSSTQTTNRDASLDLFYAAPDNLLANPDFEASTGGLTGWSTGGALSATLTTGYSGEFAASLGDPCTWPCLDGPTPIMSGTIYSAPRLLAGADGSLHMLLGGDHYLWTSASGWQFTHTFGHPQNTYADGYLTDMFLDTSGNLHIAWSENQHPNTTVYYTRRSPASAWMPRETVGLGSSPTVRANPAGQVLVAYYSGASGTFYRQRFANGSWADPVNVGTEYGYQSHGLAVGPDGSFYLLGTYLTGGYMPLTKILRDGTRLYGVFNALQKLGYEIHLLVDKQSNLHIVWRGSGDQIEHLLCEFLPGRTGFCELQHTLGTGPYHLNVILDGSDGMHLFGAPGGSLGYYYAYRLAGGDWTALQEVFPTAGTARGFGAAVQPNGDLALVWGWDPYLVIAHTRRQPSAASAWLQQSLSLPANLNHPTLAFAHRLLGSGSWKDTDATLQVQAAGILTPTTAVYTSTSTTGWEHDWLDLFPYAGSTITLTFSLHQAKGEPVVKLLIDHVSLGAWNTPVISQLSPPSIPAWNITIHQVSILGENFLPGAQVRLGNTTLACTRLDETALLCDVPTTLKLGTHDVRVLNPGGEQAVLPGGLRLGYSLFLPALRR